MRAMVFWSLSVISPKSASDIGDEVGKSAATIRYHLAHLFEVGLILAVGTRKKRSRTETLYVMRARLNMSLVGPEAGELYNRYAIRGLKLDTQKLVREAAHAMGLREVREDVSHFHYHRRHHIRLSAERAEKLKADLSAAIHSAGRDQIPREDGGIEVHIAAFVTPTLHQTGVWAEEIGLSLDSLNRDGIPHEDEAEE